jgi:hypothetical protein
MKCTLSIQASPANEGLEMYVGGGGLGGGGEMERSEMNPQPPEGILNLKINFVYI